jgi:multiple sugar transport system permease protein
MKSKALFRDKISPWLFLLPGIIVFALFKYYAIFLGVFVTLFDFNIVNPPGVFIGLKNYLQVLKDPEFYNAFRNNVEFLLITLVMNFWVPIVIAVLVNEVRKHKTFFRSIYFIPAIVPTLAIGMVWKFIWQPDYGFANYLLSLVHIAPQLWLNNAMLVKWCMRFPYLVMGGGLNFVIFLAALQEIPEEEMEASLIDGAGYFQRIRYLVLPYLLPVVGIILTLTVIDAFNYFDDVMIMTGGGPAGATETITLFGFLKVYNDTDYSYANTVYTISFVIVLIFTIIKMRIDSIYEKKGR